MKQTIIFLTLLLILVLASCGIAPQTPEPILDAQGEGWKSVGGFVDEFTLLDSPSMEQDRNGNLIVAYVKSGRIYVKRWNGTSWILLGNLLNYAPNQAARNPSLAIDSLGNPVVAWSERFYDTGHGVPHFAHIIRIKRWNGSSWQAYPVNNGDLVNIKEGLDAYKPSLALDTNNVPVIAFLEESYTLGTGYIFNAKVVHYVSGSWLTYIIGGDGSMNLNATHPSHSLSLALDSTGKPVIAWSESTSTSGTNNNIYVKRWNGSNWILIGSTPLDVNQNNSAIEPSLIVNILNNPVITWSENGQIYTRQFNVDISGVGSWSNYKTINLDISHTAHIPSLAKSLSGQLAIAWSENNASGVSNVYTKILQGGQWNLVANSTVNIDPNKNATQPSLAFDKYGNTTVAWVEGITSSNKNIYVKRYETAFDYLGTVDRTLSNNAFGSSVARKNDDLPIVAWTETNGSSNDVFVKEWTGSGWKSLGSRLDRSRIKNAEYPQIAVSTNNLPVVAWTEYTGSIPAINVRRWDGLAWQFLGGPVATGYLAGLALDRSDNPIVAYNYNDNAFVKRWNGTAWVGMDGSTNPAALSTTYSDNITLALDTTGKPFVAWGEAVTGGQTIKIKYWNGTTWLEHLIPSYPANYRGMSLAIDSNNYPVLAWSNNFGQTTGSFITRKIFVSHFDGIRWAGYASLSSFDILTSGNCDAIRPKLKLDRLNKPVITWLEEITNCGGSGLLHSLQLKYFDGFIWKNYATDPTLSNAVDSTSLALKSTGLPMVSWDEGPDFAHDVFAKQY